MSEGSGGERVCAVVVTYNRLELLRECLAALRAQERKLDQVLVIDNASSDGTQAAVREEFPEFDLVAMPDNRGGAGGFEEGVRRAYEGGNDWIWLMDDDTIPRPAALSALLGARDRLEGLPQPLVLASRVFGMDGELHPMNIPRVQTADMTHYFEATSRGLLPIRFTSFVSMLMHRDAVEKYGLPHGHFFIWVDDYEYSARILRNETGYAVPESIVDHKNTPRPTSHAGERYYYEIRNKLFALRGGAFGPEDRMEFFRQGVHMTQGIGAYLKHEGVGKTSLKTVARGLWDGATKPPRG